MLLIHQSNSTSNNLPDSFQIVQSTQTSICHSFALQHRAKKNEERGGYLKLQMETDSLFM